MLELFASTFNFIANFFAGIGVINGIIGVVIIAVVGLVVTAGRFANAVASIVDLVKRFRGTNSSDGASQGVQFQADSTGDYKMQLIDKVANGSIAEETALKLAYALAGERFKSAPPEADAAPTGQEPADEFIREFVRLATSKNEQERKAAALDLEGKTEEALALLAELAEEEAQLACTRWKSRGAMAYNQFTAKAIESYERAVGCNPDDAEAHIQLGNLCSRTGDAKRAEEEYQHVLSLGNRTSDKSLVALASCGLGLIETTKGNLDEAEEHLKRSLEIELAQVNKVGIARDYGNLGLIEQTRGNLDAAEAYHQIALALHEELGHKEGMAATYGNLGVIEKTRGNLDAAEAYHQKSLAIEEELGRKEGVAATYGNLGTIEQTRGNLDAAEAYHQKSLALNEELGRKEGVAATYGNLGLIEQTRGNLDAAKAYHKKSLAIDEELGRKEGMAATYGNLGLIEELRGNLNGALDYWRRSLALYQQIGMPHMIEKIQGWIDEAEAQKE